MAIEFSLGDADGRALRRWYSHTATNGFIDKRVHRQTGTVIQRQMGTATNGYSDRREQQRTGKAVYRGSDR